MDAIDPAHWNTLVSVSVPVLGLLLLGNLAFGVRLINKLERLDTLVSGTFPVYDNRLQAVEAAALRIKIDLKEVGTLRERIAVLEYATKSQRTIQV